MKKTALLYALWEKNLPALRAYLAGRPRIVVVPDAFVTPALTDAIRESGSELRTVSSSHVQDAPALRQDVANRFGQVKRAFASVNWYEFQSAHPAAGSLERPALDQLNLQWPVMASWLSSLDALTAELDFEIALVNEAVLQPGKLLSLWSRAHGVPVLLVSHGTALGRAYSQTDESEASLPDHIAVFSERSAQFFRDCGVAEERIAIIGNPAWDVFPQLAAQRPQLRAALSQNYGLPANAKWVLYGTTWNAQLSALDNRDFLQQFDALCHAHAEVCRQLGGDVWLIVKDRLTDVVRQSQEAPFREIAARYGIEQRVVYTLNNGQEWVASADVVISSGSNLSIEAVLAGTPAIDVVSDFSLLTGTVFAPDEGIVSVEWPQLAAAVTLLVGDQQARNTCLNVAQAVRGRFNRGTDGLASQRLAELIAKIAGSGEAVAEVPVNQGYVWQTHLDVQHTDVEVAYHDTARSPLIDAFQTEPTFVLDIGCAAGANSGLLKQRFPKAKVWGLEINEGAAAEAAKKIDHVLVGKFEDFDLEKEGIAPGSLDGVILADVLEHMYNPWSVLVALRPFLAPNAQVIISIPNVRNLRLMRDLTDGYWEYEPAGLLDITHIRFFTLTEFRRVLFETGYHFKSVLYSLDAQLQSLFTTLKDRETIDVEVGRLSMKGLSRDDFTELCSLQFIMRVGVGEQPADLLGKYAGRAALSRPAAPRRVERLAVVVHLPESPAWAGIATRLKQIPIPFDLFVTTTLEQAASVQAAVGPEYPQARLGVYEDCGRDIWPLISLLRDEPVAEYDYVCKVYGARQADGEQYPADLLQAVLPSTEEIEKTLAVFRQYPDVGIQTAKKYLWNSRHHVALHGAQIEALEKQLGFDPMSLDYEFAADGMFWCRGKALQALQTLGLNQGDFAVVPEQYDSSLAYSVERVLPLVAAKAGLRTVDFDYDGQYENPRIGAESKRYANWLAQRQLSNSQGRLIDARLAQLPLAPVRIYIVDRTGSLDGIIKTINSLSSQFFKSVVPTIVSSLADPMVGKEGGLTWLTAESAGYATLLAHATTVDEGWIAIVEAGDQFNHDGLLLSLLAATEHPDWAAVYADDDWLDTLRNPVYPRFKPDFNLDMLRSIPYADGLLLLKRSTLDYLADPTQPLEEGAEQIDALLRVFDREGFAAIGHFAEIVCHLAPHPWRIPGDEQYRNAFGRAVLAHYRRNGLEVAVEPDSAPGSVRTHFLHPTQPLVSILVPTKDQLPVLRRCVESLLEKTTYPNYELLIIDNNSETKDALAYLEGIAAFGNPRVRVLRYPKPFNFSAINNFAAREAQGEYLLLLNNDTAIVQANWIEEMLHHAQRPEVGAVGAKLYFPDGRIQHAGVVLGLRGPADHPFIGLPLDAPGYMNRLLVDQNYSVVTAACMMVRKSVYEAMHGMDEGVFKVSYNDVDLCLKIREAGYLVVWTPHATVLHEGSVSQTRIDPVAQEAKRKRFQGEQDAMYRKWLPQLAQDPAYNKNLFLHGNGFEPEVRPLVTWQPLSWRPAPRVLAHPADSMGCGQYRIIQPFMALENDLQITGGMSWELLNPVDLQRVDPDVLVLQRQISDEQLRFLGNFKNFSQAFKVYELDDYLPNLPLKSAHRSHMPKDIVKSLRRALTMVDRFVVSSEPLADAFAGFHPDIRVVHNRLPVEWWGSVASQRRVGRKPRVGWAGGASHTGDLELIADVVKELAGEVEWVFFGMCPDKLRPHVHEFHGGVPISEYPAKLASLNLDLALAPLEYNQFNDCKSNLRLLEYGICGFPVIATDSICYRGDLPVTLVKKNKHKDWVDAIRAHLADLDETARRGDALREVVRKDWMLSGDNLDKWRRAWLPD
ncbi:glycosyltransferase [Andreprevotia chitinilytica]|uniref:glycosyltransferase n=1 Tax=Andreprevotia chitinilytica TaxID=396808 RepID=UPI0006899FDA|nr:glycosyltransferase [Andreprevotia chitinilytica]